MARYELLTRLSNGRKPAHPVGKVMSFEDDEAASLIKLGAIRAIAGDTVEAGGEPIGTAQRATAAGTADGPLNFITASAALRKDLEEQTVKQLDAIIEDEKIELDGSPNKSGKVEAILTARSGKLLGRLNRGGLLDLAAASGYADVAALELAEDAAEDEIRAALMRVAAARAD